MVGLTSITMMSMFMIFVFMTMESDCVGSFDTWVSRILACLSAGVCFSCVCIIVWKLSL